MFDRTGQNKQFITGKLKIAILSSVIVMRGGKSLSESA